MLPTEFSVESGELTPTQKVRRKVVAEQWREVIESLYATASAEKPASGAWPGPLAPFGRLEEARLS